MDEKNAAGNLKLGEKAGNLKNKQNFRNGRRLEPTATNLQTGAKIFLYLSLNIMLGCHF